MARARGEEAMQAVMSTQDLVEKIVHLTQDADSTWQPPKLMFSEKQPEQGLPTDRVYWGAKDRWRCGQVSRVFRAASLRLAWGATWDARKAGSERARLEDFAARFRSRTLQSLTVKLKQQTLAECAALLSHASRLVELEVVGSSDNMLERWLRTPVVPAGGGTAAQGMPVLSCLSSLSGLRSLKVQATSTPFKTTPWLTAVSQLTRVVFTKYAGPSPVAGLPHLEDLSVSFPLTGLGNRGNFKCPLEQWGSPRLTALFLSCCELLLESPETGGSASVPAADSSAQTCLRALVSFRSYECRLSLGNRSLQDVMPGLTQLRHVWSRSEGSLCFDAVLKKGLPVGLKTLVVTSSAGLPPEHLWQAVSALANLVSFEASFAEKVFKNEEDVSEMLGSLSSLPGLKQTRLSLMTLDRPGLKKSFRGLDDLLRGKGGRLNLTLKAPRLVPGNIHPWFLQPGLQPGEWPDEGDLYEWEQENQ